MVERVVDSIRGFDLSRDQDLAVAGGDYYRMETWDRFQRLVGAADNSAPDLRDRLQELCCRDSTDFPDRQRVERELVGQGSDDLRRAASEYCEFLERNSGAMMPWPPQQ